MAQQKYETYAELLQQCFFFAYHTLKKIQAEKEQARQGHDKHGRSGHYLNPEAPHQKGNNLKVEDHPNHLSVTPAR